MNGIDMLAAAVGLLIILAAVVFYQWREQDHYRRVERLVHRNLQRAAGQR